MSRKANMGNPVLPGTTRPNPGRWKTLVGYFKKDLVAWMKLSHQAPILLNLIELP